MPTCPDSVKRLIERFTEQADQVCSPDYNETQVRIDFIDPFMAALGWDMNNDAGYALQYRDVVHEDRVKVGGQTKAPDYSFRIGGTRKFFLEAKKPAVKIKTNVEAAYQLRRYAWSAKLPVSILTDFQEFAVYDGRVRPKYLDSASKARREYIRYTEYEDRWDFIEGTFSKAAVLRGDFDRYADTKKGRGAQEIDDAFLEEIEGWRLAIASNLALRNKSLDEHALNFAVQRIIDRIIFLRIAEDRGSEQADQLKDIAKEKNAYDHLVDLFKQADDRYNSGLFHFRNEKGRDHDPDTLTPALHIDDKTIKGIIEGLYYPQSPYVFNVVTADLLGSVYERFLGKVITLTKTHRAKIEEKPEVRKAGGVYYTPTYIVDYIVQNTVGKLLEGKTPKQAEKIKVLDPACGSGSFLIGAYDYLLRWYLKQYTEDTKKDAKKHTRGKAAKLRQASVNPLAMVGEDLRKERELAGYTLTIAERKRILLTHIHGVDLDHQAVEVSKLNLLLKCLEGETRETLGFSDIFRKTKSRERALPDLGNNIICGNSLIGTDIIGTDAWSEMSEDERVRINPFDYADTFEDVFIGKNGGFHVVIGNPPYILLQDDFRQQPALDYYKIKFPISAYKLDTYHLFMTSAPSWLRAKGQWGFITPSNYMTNNHLEKLRRSMVREGPLLVNSIYGQVFKGASVDTAVTVQSVSKNRKAHAIQLIESEIQSESLREVSQQMIDGKQMLEHQFAVLTSARTVKGQDLLRRLKETFPTLGESAHVNFGKQLRHRKKYRQDVIEVNNLKSVPATHRPCLTGSNINRYHLAWGGLACLNDEVARRGGCWLEERHNGTAKLITRQIGKYPSFAIETQGIHCLNTVFMINVHQSNIDPIAILGALNSKLLRYYWENRFYDRRKTFPKIKGTYLKLLPIPAVAGHLGTQSKLNKPVQSMISLQQRIADEKHTQKRTQLQREIDATDRKIDQLVYELYGLTDDEIALVEEATAK